MELIENKFIKKLAKDKIVLTALVVLVLMYICIAFAGFFTPYPPNFSDRTMSYSPPSKIFIINQEGKLSWPYTYNYKRHFNPETFRMDYTLDRSEKYFLKFLSSGRLITVDEPGRLFLLGADINGRDVFSRLFYGGRISLTIGFLALLISFPIGLIYGGIAGYFGGLADNLMMRLAEAIMSIPSFFLLITLAAVLPSGMTSAQRFALITVILAFIGWAGFSRVVRGMVLSIKNREFVEASRAIGASSFRIITRDILPQTASYVIVAMTLSVPGYILAESGLSFLGLGIQQPDASWGNMLKEAQEYINVLYRPWLLMPGFLIFIAVLAFNIVGDAVRDILDPKSRMRR